MKIMKQSDLKRNKKYKALLVGISGSHNSYCLSLYNLKSYAFSNPLLRHDWDIDIIQESLITQLDYKIRVDSLVNKILEFGNIHLYAFSCYMWNMKYVCEICKLIKEKYPFSRIVLGGPEISKDWAISGSYDEIDVDLLVFGEGEKVFENILLNIQNEEVVDKLKGIAFKKEGKWIINSSQEVFKKLDDIPSPYVTGCVDDNIFSINDIQANIETQRGCSLRCSYCIYHKDMPKIAYGQVARVLNEVDFILNKGCKRIRFVDANFASDLTYTKAIMKGLIDRKVEATIFAELIPGFVDEELADLFKQYNNLWEWNYITLGIGVQSINLDTLRLVKRRINIEKFDKTFELLSSRGIYAKIDIILGLPGENIISIAKTQEYMLSKLKYSRAHLLCCHTMRGLPGTELFKLAKDYGMVFSSKNEPHELIESPLLPRKDMILVLRRTAIVFRIINPGFSKTIYVREKFYEIVEKLKCTHLEIIDYLIDQLIVKLPKDSWFVDNEFPYAETWWWECSSKEISDEMIIELLNLLSKNHRV